jgi:uncharacterized iron-regulated membrane protein
MTFRKLLFWTHLTAGVMAGIVIFIMSITGVLLAFQREIVNFADRTNIAAVSKPTSSTLPVEDLLQRASDVAKTSPSAITVFNSPEQPVRIEFGRDRALFFDPYTGTNLGESSSGIREVLRVTTDLHRWLAVGPSARPIGRAIAGACNLIFLGIVLSGLYLWLPRSWSWRNVRAILWCRRGLSGKPRDFNWHNVVGIWCAIPLAVVVATAVVMSYGWANNAVYRITGTQPPSRDRERPPQAAGIERPQSSESRRGDRHRDHELSQAQPQSSPFTGLNTPLQRAKSQDATWQQITMRLPENPHGQTISFNIVNGYEGRPDRRAQLVLARSTAEVVRWEPFSNNNAGRRLRSWIRFLHTGEAGGWFGEGIAAIVSAGGAFLVYTGLSLALRRFFGWKGRRPSRKSAAVQEDARRVSVGT